MASSVIGALGTLQQGNASYQSGMYNSARLETSADMAIDQGEAAVSKQQRDVSRVLSAQKARAAANGIDPGFGSALDVMEASAKTGALDRDIIRYNAKLKAFNYRSEASLARMGGESARAASYYSAAGQLLGGGEKAASFMVGGGA